MTTTGQPRSMNVFTHFRVLSPPSATISTRITLCSTVDKDRGYNALNWHRNSGGRIRCQQQNMVSDYTLKKTVYDKSCVKSNVLPGRSVTVASTTITNFLSLLSVWGGGGGGGEGCVLYVCVCVRAPACLCVCFSISASVSLKLKLWFCVLRSQ